MKQLVFIAADNGGFAFDTGVLRGKLRPNGRGIGLASVVHVPTGLPLDRGEKGYGIGSHYRVFGNGKRFGGGAWDWPGTARLLDSGAVEVLWPATAERPFEMRAVYRWIAADLLEIETIVKPSKLLAGFESFLASYFAESFTNCLALVGDCPAGSGKAGLMPVDKARGDWQMFPRDRAVAALINDGRWQLPPNPVKWQVMPPLAQPVGVRRAPQSGLTVVLLAPSSSCFAIAAPYETETHYSLYLSQFGRDLKAGETARARARLWVAVNPTLEGIQDQCRRLDETAGE